jgi:hypothetical protein
VEVVNRWRNRSNRCLGILGQNVACNAGGFFMRTGTRGYPSWPGLDPETGYVDADRIADSNHPCGRGGPYVLTVMS